MADRSEKSMLQPWIHIVNSTGFESAAERFGLVLCTYDSLMSLIPKAERSRPRLRGTEFRPVP